MDSYKTFASVYDLFMDNVPYDDWCDLYSDILAEHGVTDGIMLDLGCGTGTMTRRFSRRGFDMIGVDASEEMLEMAREAELLDEARTFDTSSNSDVANEAVSDNASNQAKDILYLQQDMRSFELYGTVAAVVSVCDSLNYILTEEDLLQVFRLVNNYLDPGGLFVFDMTTPYQYENVLGENSFCESRDEAAFLWENFFDEENRINEYDLTLFVREGNDRIVEGQNKGNQNASALNEEERYRRFVETHYQRAWTLDEVKALLNESGLELLAVFGEDGKNPLEDMDGRMYFVARECMK